MDTCAALCWLFLSGFIAGVVLPYHRHQVSGEQSHVTTKLHPDSERFRKTTAKDEGPGRPHPDSFLAVSSDSAHSPALFFDYPDDDKNRSAEISIIIGEPPLVDTNAKLARILRMILIGSVVVVIILILYHVLCRLFCAFGV